MQETPGNTKTEVISSPDNEKSSKKQSNSKKKADNDTNGCYKIERFFGVKSHIKQSKVSEVTQKEYYIDLSHKNETSIFSKILDLEPKAVVPEIKPKEKICHACGKSGETKSCSYCFLIFHKECVKLNNKTPFACDSCT